VTERGQKPPYLIVEPDPVLARQLTIKLGRHAPTVVAGSVAEAKILANERDAWSGICTELRLPDGSGLDLVERLRRNQPELCALVLSRLHDPALLGQEAHGKRTILASKPVPGQALSAFLVESLGIKRPESSLPPVRERGEPPPSVPPKEANRDFYEARVDAVRAEAKKGGLTDEETLIVGMTVEGRSPDETIKELGIDPRDWDTRVASILDKTNAHNMGQLALRIVKEAMSSSGGE
jgi:DNA-binding NarL/FixJ family response regulator